MNDKNKNNLIKALIDYLYSDEARNFEESFDIDTDDYSEKELISLCKKNEEYANHIFYKILLLNKMM